MTGFSASGTNFDIASLLFEMYEFSGVIAPSVAHEASSSVVPRSMMSGGLPPLIAERIFASLVTGVSVIWMFGCRCSYSLMAESRAASSCPPPHCCHIVR